MSATTPPLPATPGHTRDELLDMVGRAGTPPVDERTFRVDALSLTGHGQTSSHPGVPAGGRAPGNRIAPACSATWPGQRPRCVGGRAPST